MTSGNNGFEQVSRPHDPVSGVLATVRVMRLEFVYFIPDRSPVGRVLVDPVDPLAQLIRRVEHPTRTLSGALIDLAEDAWAIADRIATSDDPSLPGPEVSQLGDRTMLLSFHCDDLELAFGDTIQLAIDADVGLAELASGEIYVFGDDDRKASLYTADHEVPWTSPASLASFVHRVNPAHHDVGGSGTDDGYLEHFLLLVRQNRPDRFLQAYVDQTRNCWVVEVADDGTRWVARYRHQRTVAYLAVRWFHRGIAPVLAHGWWSKALDDGGIPGRDTFGRFLGASLPEQDLDDGGDDDDGDCDVPVFEPLPQLT